MRKILFRGFNKKNNLWINGFYFQNRGTSFVCQDEWADGKSWNDYEVDRPSVGQFTGVYDYEGKMIFEGDIISGRTSDYIIVYSERHGAFLARYTKNPNVEYKATQEWVNEEELNVSGNMYDNYDKMGAVLDKAKKQIECYFEKLEAETLKSTLKNAFLGAEWMMKNRDYEGVQKAKDELFPIPDGGRSYADAWGASAFEKGAWITYELLRWSM